MKTIIRILLIVFLAAGTTLWHSCKKKEVEEVIPDPNPTPGPTPPPALISGGVTGNPFSSGKLTNFAFAYNSGSVILLAANNTTGKIYAIDINDKDSTQATANAITGNVSNFASQIASQLGTTLSNIDIRNMELNPLSKSLYVLVRTISTNNFTLFKATAGGNTLSIVDLSNVTYCALPFSTTGETIWDMTWGDNTLYISFSQSSGLNGKVASMGAPFKNDSAFTNRATTVYKTNWGGGYFTDAPLETMTYGVVDGEKRLMGVTVCAPGFSFKTSDITGGGLLQVKEWYNLNGGGAKKAFCIYSGNDTYLVEHHYNGRITRIGEKYLNESQSSFNATAPLILTGGGSTVALGLTDADVKIVAPIGTYVAATKNSNTQLLALNSSGVLSLISI